MLFLCIISLCFFYPLNKVVLPLIKKKKNFSASWESPEVIKQWTRSYSPPIFSKFYGHRLSSCLALSFWGGPCLQCFAHRRPSTRPGPCSFAGLNLLPLFLDRQLSGPLWAFWPRPFLQPKMRFQVSFTVHTSGDCSPTSNHPGKAD